MVVGALVACGRAGPEADSEARRLAGLDETNDLASAGRRRMRSLLGALGGTAQWAALRAACDESVDWDACRQLLEHWNCGLVDALEYQDKSEQLPRRHHGVSSLQACRVLRAVPRGAMGAELVFLAALADPDGSVRQEAVSALTETAGSECFAAELFMGVHGHIVRLRSALVQVIAAGAVRDVTLLAMRSALRDSDARIREVALHAASLSPEWALALDRDLRRSLAEPAAMRERLEAAIALAAHGSTDSMEAWRFLTELVSAQQGVDTRLYVLGRMRMIDRVPAAFLRAVVQLLADDDCAWSEADSDPSVTCVACRAMELVAGIGVVALAEVEREYAVAQGAARRRLEVLLLRLGAPMAERQLRLYEALVATDLVVQRGALAALRSGDATPDVLRLLTEFVLGAGWRVEAAADALARLGLPARDAIAAVITTGSEYAAHRMLAALDGKGGLIMALSPELRSASLRAVSEEVRQQAAMLLGGE